MNKKPDYIRRWHQHEIDVVRDMVSIQGLSFKEVATIFYTTKSSIAGLCYRHNIKYAEKFFKPTIAKQIMPKNYGDKITKVCLNCQEEFKTFIKLEKKYCDHKCATAYHNKFKAVEKQAAPTSPKKSWLNLPLDSLQCHCGNYAVPKHQVCYEHA